MSLNVTPVRGKGDRETFVKLPYTVYADDPHYVYPLLTSLREFLDEAKNPFFRHAETELWLARRDGKVVGRIAACVDRYHIEHHDEQTGFFGFFEALDDAEAAAALLSAAREWLRGKGMETMRGPLNFTTNHDAPGLLIDGEPSPPVFGMAYNPPYYPAFFDDFGLVKTKDLWAWQVRAEKMDIPDRIQKNIASIRETGSFKVRPIDMDNFERDVDIIRALYNACWSRNWGFIPMDREEFLFAAKDFKKLVNPRFLLIAEKDSEPVGFCMTVPDFNIALKSCRGRLFPFGWLKFMRDRKKVNYARTLLLGVLPEARHKGVDVMMVFGTFKAGFKAGIAAGECSWMLEDNDAMNRIMAGIGAKVYTPYRVSDLALT